MTVASVLHYRIQLQTIKLRVYLSTANAHTYLCRRCTHSKLQPLTWARASCELDDALVFARMHKRQNGLVTVHADNVSRSQMFTLLLHKFQAKVGFIFVTNLGHHSAERLVS